MKNIIEDLETIGFKPAKQKRPEPDDEIEDDDIDKHQATESWSGRYV